VKKKGKGKRKDEWKTEERKEKEASDIFRPKESLLA
jgi:hypothetical protein